MQFEMLEMFISFKVCVGSDLEHIQKNEQ